MGKREGGPPKAFPPGVDPRALVGRSLLDAGLIAPFLSLDDVALAANVGLMARYCERSGVSIAPHGKTTMAPAIIRRQLAAGAWGITAATAWQALVMHRFGVPRVLIANEVSDLDSARALASALAADPAFELLVSVDSVDGAELIGTAFPPGPSRRRLSVLVEIGFAGGRAGCRDLGAARVVAQAALDAGLRLAGVMGYEGIIDGATPEEREATVAAYLDGVGSAARSLADDGAFARAGEIVITAGGSVFFDRVVDRLGPIAERLGARLVLRSGCYVTHDDGFYEERSPFGSSSATAKFLPALTLWAHVLSRPEPALAIAGFGRRDAPYDHGLPVVRRVIRDSTRVKIGQPLEVYDLNDQHAFIRIPPDADIRLGDLLDCGISHPCSAFDRWRCIPLVDSDGLITDVIETYF
jgi:D-serine deaminase-like pyridoxal phosphate-dependent protein